MSCLPLPVVCCECGTGPLGCKVVGPTLGFFFAILSAILFFPLGALVYCCDRILARQFWGYPGRIWSGTAQCLPF
ncbi:hypothetical protein BDZ88DRAFT_415508 [Geranomyces variabilis]|nr:hypothetical protein BDZ88DRAFT_415508 [Geranomyces variabilis]